METTAELRATGDSTSDVSGAKREINDSVPEQAQSKQLDDSVHSTTPDILGRGHILHRLGVPFKHIYKKLRSLGSQPPDEARILYRLGMSFIHQYQQQEDLNDLEMAMQTMQQVVALTPKDHQNYANRLQTLGLVLGHWYQEKGDPKDLEAALQAMQESLALIPPNHPARAGRLQDLSKLFRQRYTKLRDLEGLEAALQADKEAVALTSQSDTNYADRLWNLGVSFNEKYERLGNVKDLEAALPAMQKAVNLLPHDHPERAGRLQTMSASFRHRSRVTGGMSDLEAALEADQEAVALTQDNHSEHAVMLHSLGTSLMGRYQREGSLEDLETALEKIQQAVALTSLDDPDRGEVLKNLGVSFMHRYSRLGDLKDLEAALRAMQQAVDLTPLDHRDRAHRLQSLSMSFYHRSTKLGDLDDLEAALKAAQEAVDITPQNHPNRGLMLHGLVASLMGRYHRRGQLKDLEAGLCTIRELVVLTPLDHPARAEILQNLGVALIQRYRKLGDLQDLEAAVQAGKEAVALTPPDYPNRGGILQKLGVALRDRYKKLGDSEDLEAAVQVHWEAVAITPYEHPDRADRLQSLAIALTSRFRKFKDPQDLETIHMHYSDSFIQPSLTPEISWRNALQWASFSQKFDPVYCIPAYMVAFRLLPEILWIGNSIPARQEVIHRLDIAEATSKAVHACIQQSNLPAAVELLEQGLATIFQQMLQLTPQLKNIPPQYAKDFQALSLQLYNGTPENAITIVEDRNKVLDRIRKEEGCGDFLLQKPYNVLCLASQGGPVIILTSHPKQCTAIIIHNKATQPFHVPLPGITLTLLKSQQASLKVLLGRCNVRSRGQPSKSRLTGRPEGASLKAVPECFEDILAWLWTNVVNPVYVALKSCGISKGRLWWLPTGAFTGLPMHASPPTDEFIHSYTPTLSSLLDAYAKKSRIPPKLALVGVTHTDSKGSNYLRGVDEEVKNIMAIVKEAPVHCILGGNATVDTVKDELQQCSWVHLGCHGIQSPGDPTVKSHLKLYEGDLDLETILRLPLPNAQFVFLAACQTAMGDANMINESFHLGGGFMTAGFRSVIGTMWSMNDSDGPVVAKIIYSHLFCRGTEPQASDAAEALQIAVRELKNRKVPYERWVPFIHMGI
ncbi:CHAT domain-containing protein [Mycena vitilis]|nr:CHAT domain-containing protein [Mycena vitilis]